MRKKFRALARRNIEQKHCTNTNCSSANRIDYFFVFHVCIMLQNLTVSYMGGSNEYNSIFSCTPGCAVVGLFIEKLTCSQYSKYQLTA
jgi:hypothetical protein